MAITARPTEVYIAAALTLDARDHAQRQAQFFWQLHRLGRFVAIDQTDASPALL